MNGAGTAVAPGPSAGRPRDAAASKAALLEAAAELFGQRGFERTTVRDIGERAGVDAALIARYFGGKADLYIAAVAAERMGEGGPVEFERLDQIADALVSRTDRHGPGPILQALIRSDTSDEIRAAAQSRLARRLVEPLVTAMEDQAVDQAKLRAEIAVSALIGVCLGRSLGWFATLPAAGKDELVALITEALSTMTGPA